MALPPARLVFCRYVRCYVHLAALGYKISGVVALVGSYRYPLRSRDLLDHQ